MLDEPAPQQVWGQPRPLGDVSLQCVPVCACQRPVTSRLRWFVVMPNIGGDFGRSVVEGMVSMACASFWKGLSQISHRVKERRDKDRPSKHAMSWESNVQCE